MSTTASIQEQLVQARAELELESAKTEIERLKAERKGLEEYNRWLGPRSDEFAENGPSASPDGKPTPRKSGPTPRNLAEAIWIGTQRSIAEAYSDYASYTGTGWGALVDPLDAYTDVDGFLLPSAGVADRRTNATSLLTPLIRNELQLLMVRGAARLLLDMNPFAIGILENLTAFVVGDGMPTRSVWRKGHERKGDNLPLLIQDTLDEFYERLAYDEFQQELVWRTSRDGEYFLRHEAEQLGTGFRTGLLDIHIVEPEFVTQEGAPSDIDPQTGFDAWSWGIHTPHERPQQALEYNLKPWSSSANELVSAERIVHAKVNVDRNLKRGIPDFAPVADGMEGCRKLVRNTREGAAVMAAIAGIWEYENTPGSQVQSGVTANRDAYRAYNPNPVTGKPTNYQKIEPGTFIHGPKNKQFKPLAAGQSNTPGYVQAVQMALRGVAVRWGMPEYIVSADASNANFASILVAGSPFVRQIIRRQKFHKRRFLATLWHVVHCAWQARRYGDVPWSFIKSSIELLMEAPVPQIADRVQEAQASEIEHRNGVLSTQTWQQRRGYDADTEKKNFEEQPLQQPGGGQPGDQSGGGNPGPNTGDALGGLGSFFPGPVRPTESRSSRRSRRRGGIQLAENFTGTVTDSAGRKIHYVNGKRVKGSEGGDGGSTGDHTRTDTAAEASAALQQKLAGEARQMATTSEGLAALSRGEKLAGQLRAGIAQGVQKALDGIDEESGGGISLLAGSLKSKNPAMAAAGVSRLVSTVFRCVHEEMFEQMLSDQIHAPALAGKLAAKVAAKGVTLAEHGLMKAAVWAMSKIRGQESIGVFEAQASLTEADRQLLEALGGIAAQAIRGLLAQVGVAPADVSIDTSVLAERIGRMLQGQAAN